MRFFKKSLWSVAVLGIGFFASYFFWASGSLVYQNVSNKIATLCASENCVAAVNNTIENSYSLKNKNKSLSISSGAYLIGDVDSGEIILSKAENIRYPIASVTKLVTSLVAIEMFKDTQVLKDAAAKVQEIYGSKNNSNGNVQNTDFLYPLLLRSSNQTAEILANEVGWPNFIRQMNEKTSLIGMYSTLFSDPSGLSQENVSTAKDLFLLAKYLKNKRPEILELTKTEREETLGLVWTNNSRFLSNRGYLGGKTGFTNAAKQTLLAIFSVPLKNGSISAGSAETKRRNIAVIILQSPDRANDVQKILNYLRENVLYNKEELLIPEIQKEGEELNEDNTLNENNFDLEREADPIIITTLKKSDDNLKIRDDRQEHFEINAPLDQPDWFPKNIIITINDGPHIHNASKQFLDILNKYEVKATFFMVGKFIDKDFNNRPEELREYLRKLLTYGHIIGYHSYKHRNFYFPGFPRLDQQSEEKIIEDINAFEKILNKALGYDYKLKYGRMPGGSGTFSQKVIDAFNKKGLEKPKYWHTDKIPTDPAEIAKILKKKEQYIILLNESKKGASDLEKFLKEVYRQTQIANQLGLESQINTEKHDPQQSVSLAFVGDIMLDRGVKNSVTKNFGGDYNALFANLAELKDYDILFGNLEGPVSDKGNNVGSKYSFRMDPIVLPILKDAGFDIVSFANNHAGDFGLAGFKDTLSRLDSAGIFYTGTGLNKKDAEEPVIIEKNGIKIGFLGFSDAGPNWLAAKENTAGILLASDPNFEKIIQNAKAKTDILVVSFHFGEEYAKINTRQKTLAYKAIDNGADIVIGNHPHVIQETENYKDRFIAYSLGNFIFDQYFSPETMQGLVLEINVDKEKNLEISKKLVKLNRKYQPEGLFPFNENDFDYNNLKELSQNAKTNAELKNKQAIENICPAPKKTFPDLLLYNINLENSIGDYIPENLVPIKNQINTQNKDICLTEQVLNSFKKMSEDAKKENVSLVVTSGFRDTELQKYFYDRSIEKNSISPEFSSVAPPSFSEHQLGTTVDLTSPSLNYASTALLFDQTAEYSWLKDNAYKYGFIESYPKDKESITGFVYEPWHWRFIGKEIAEKIKSNSLTINEYLKDYDAPAIQPGIGG